MKFEKRIRALEARLLADQCILFFADGSTREICGGVNILLDLFAGACGGADLSPGQVEQLELIRQSVSAQEPGGGHMTELVRCVLHAHAEERSSLAPVRG